MERDRTRFPGNRSRACLIQWECLTRGHSGPNSIATKTGTDPHACRLYCYPHPGWYLQGPRRKRIANRPREERGEGRGARMSSTSVSSGLTSLSSPRRVLNIAAYRKLWSGNLACRLRASSRSGEEESTSGTSPELVGTLETLKLRSRQDERRREKTGKSRDARTRQWQRDDS